MGEVMEAIMAAAVLGAEVAVAAVPGAVAAADLAAVMAVAAVTAAVAITRAKPFHGNEKGSSASAGGPFCWDEEAAEA